MTHFVLDVDPEAVRAAGERIRRFEEALAAEHDRLRQLLPQAQQWWHGQAATAMATEAEALAWQLAAARPHFHAAGQALLRLADALTEAVEVEVPRLNARWQQTVHDALRLAMSGPSGWQPGQPPPLTEPGPFALDGLTPEQRALEAEFDRLREDLHERARSAGRQLAAATAVPVDAALLRGAQGAGLGAIGPGLPELSAMGTSAATVPALTLTMLRRAAGQEQVEHDSAALGRVLAGARALGLHPRDYAEVLRAYWAALAFERAGRRSADWRPELGAEANRANILGGYDYYRALWSREPAFWWAGMANLVGPGFAAAFFDLGAARATAQRSGAISRRLDPRVGVPVFLTSLGAQRQLVQYERRFLRMQKEIFADIGGMHEAYLAGGVPAIRELQEAGVISRTAATAWVDIDVGRRTGDRQRLTDGAEGLAYREQWEVIRDDWDQMREVPAGGAAVTSAFTAAGKPSIPGAHYPGEVRPLAVPLFVPPAPPTVAVRTTLPSFDVSQAQARWDYFLADTMPAFLALDREEIQAEMSRPLEERIARERALRRVDDLATDVGPQHWRLERWGSR